MAKKTPMLQKAAQPTPAAADLQALVAEVMANEPACSLRRRIQYNTRWAKLYAEVRPLLAEKRWSAMAVAMWLRAHDRIAAGDVVRCKSAITRLHAKWKREHEQSLLAVLAKSMM